MKAGTAAILATGTIGAAAAALHSERHDPRAAHSPQTAQVVAAAASAHLDRPGSPALAPTGIDLAPPGPAVRSTRSPTRPSRSLPTLAATGDTSAASPGAAADQTDGRADAPLGGLSSGDAPMATRPVR
ncbi:MAG: hypothetical protein ACR2KV_13915 [Solirubrobacteraceae bacterium]